VCQKSCSATRTRRAPAAAARSLVPGIAIVDQAPARASARRCGPADPRARPGLTLRVGSQGGFLSILYSIGSKPLQIWAKTVQNGHIKRLTDEDIQSSVLEIMGTNVRAARRTRRLLRPLAARDSAANP
jgi:hypothetical protein